MKKKILTAFIMISCLMAVSNPVLVRAQSLSNFDSLHKLSAGGANTVALNNDGTVWSWGSYRSGKLGDGTPYDFGLTTVISPLPIQAKDLNNVVSVSGEGSHTLALKNDGTVWAWGDNYSGQLGDGTTNSSNIPIKVNGLTDVISVYAVGDGSMVLRGDGTVWVWGANTQGWLSGEDTSPKIFTPVQVKGLTDVISTGGIGLVLKNDGTVWAWGMNSSGLLGEGASFSSHTPVKVEGLTDIISVSRGNQHATALKSDGTVWTWGDNFNGQLGNDTEGFSKVPVQVEGLTDAIAISSGGYTSMALRKDGTVWEWGFISPSLSGYTKTKLVQVQGLTDVVAISAGDFHRTALKKDGTVWAWGSNHFGQLGDNTTNDSTVPVKTYIDLGPQENPQIPITIRVQAKPTSSNVLIDGKKTAFQAYNIDDNNYFKLRDLAMALNGSGKQFEITWDETRNAINLLTNKSYTAVGGELAISGNTYNKTAALTTSKVYINGNQVSLTAYNIDGYNYFKLRDVGTALNFGVSWNESTNTIIVDTTTN